MSDVLDYHSQHVLRKLIRDNGLGFRLKSLSRCGLKVNPHRNGTVALLVGEHNKVWFDGLVTCKNPWCCPVCSAQIMAEYRKKIASAIKYEKSENRFGFMFTYGIPHWGFMSCREVTDILYDTWKLYRLIFKKKGVSTAFTEFNKVVPIIDWVRVGEYTWGKKNGWHPHFHGIYWIARGDEKKVTREWEAKLDKFWMRCAKLKTIQYWKNHNLHLNLLKEGETLEDLLERLYKPQEKAGAQGCAFSRNADGSLREVNTSDYISGWGEDSELTGNCRKQASHKGHMTPYQILERAAHEPEYGQLYLDYCLGVTTKPVHHRVDFIKGKGFHARLTAFENKQLEREKMTELVRKKKERAEVVAIFEREEWYELLNREHYDEIPAISNIVWLAVNRRDLLAEYVKSLNLTRGSIRMCHVSSEELECTSA